MAWTWVLVGADGQEMRSTEPFDTKDEAEAWLSDHWAELAEEGAESVSLREGDAESYRMSLAPG
jgi:hypothetical protein